jgi:hypothetical protein
MVRLAFLMLVLGLAACDQSGTGSAPAKSVAPVAVPAYTYPAPVKGKYSEPNSGKFDLVDGVAYAADKDTVLYVTEKQIASPMLTGSACAVSQARSLALLRNSGYITVKLNAAGNPGYFEAGTPYSGRRIDRAGRTAKVSGGKAKDGRVTGSVTDKGHGQFDFDLPVAGAETTRMPTKEELFAAYKAVRQAAIKKDLKALLSAQGFDAKQIEKIRGLEAIDSDVAAHADRFLEPGAPEEPTIQPGTIRVGGSGKNSKGAKFVNYYWFAPCGDKLLLVNIGENPQ